MGHGAWGMGRWGDEEDEGDEEVIFPNAQYPMPNAQCPMPNAQSLNYLYPAQN